MATRERTKSKGIGYTIKGISPFVLIGILAVLIGITLLLGNFLRVSKPKPLGVISPDLLVNVPADQVPEDALYISTGRREYSGGMVLMIPAIELNTAIGADTDAAGLEKMPGLYEFAQMPFEEYGNVSIAGHRDIYGKEFYYLHRLQEGDLMYLILEGTVYKYLFQEAKVVMPDGWDVIRRQGFTCLTLTTCDPIGTSQKRLIITGALLDSQPYSDDYNFELRNQIIKK